MRQPQRHGSGRFDLQQHHTVRGQWLAVAARAEIQLRLAPAHVVVKGYAQIGIVRRDIGLPVARDEHLRLGLVLAKEPVYLARHLAGLRRGDAPVEIVRRFVRAHTDAALVHDTLVFLLQLHEHGVAVGGNIVASQAELFLVDGALYGIADQVVVVAVVVYAAYRALKVLVRYDVRIEELPQRLVFLAGQQIFFFVSFECKFRAAHVRLPFHY